MTGLSVIVLMLCATSLLLEAVHASANSTYDRISGHGPGLPGQPNWAFPPDEDYPASWINYEGGVYVAGLGDINGDGFDDVGLGYQYLDHAHRRRSDHSGTVFLFYGDYNGFRGDPDQVIQRNDSGEFGRTVQAAGDINGDSYGDLFITDFYSSDAEESYRGRVLLYGGSSGVQAPVLVHTFVGDAEGARLGDSIASTLDVNGDGLSDFFITQALNYGDPAGEDTLVRGYYGTAEYAYSEPDWALTATDCRGAMLMVNSGDFNGDGFDDLATNCASNSTPFIRVYNGSPEGLGILPSFSVEPGEPTAVDWRRLRSLGDINGDGYSDMATAFAESLTINIYFGSSLGLHSMTDQYFEVPSIDDAYYIDDFKAAGDVNGDGFSDLLVGYNWDTVLVFYGSPTGIRESRFWWSEDGGDWFVAWGSSFATGSDVNADAFGDILIAGGLYDGYFFTETFVMAFYGESTTTTTTTVTTTTVGTTTTTIPSQDSADKSNSTTSSDACGW